MTRGPVRLDVAVSYALPRTGLPAAVSFRKWVAAALKGRIREADLAVRIAPSYRTPWAEAARAELAAAVAEGGCLGMIERLTEEGRADLLRVRELTDRPVAANLMIQGWTRDP